MSPSSVESGNGVSVVYEILTVGDHFPQNGTTIFRVFQGGTVVSEVVDTSILSTGNIDPNTFLVSGSFPLTDVQAYQAPGTYDVEVSISGLQPGELSPEPYSDFGSTSFAVTAAPVPTPVDIVVSPAGLELSGGPGETPTTTFMITSGTPPFSLSSANSEGRGSFSNPNPGLNEVVTYGFRIPGTATDQQTFTDTITVFGADEATLSFDAITTAVVDQGGGTTQTEIDEAMQDIAQTQPQASTALVISTVCPQGIAEPQFQEDCNVMIGGAVSGGELAQQSGAALAQVTSDQASAPVDASQSSAQVQGRNVGTRLTALRAGARGMTSSLNFNIDGQPLPAATIADGLGRELRTANGGAAGGDAAMDFGRLGLFINGSVNLGDRDKTSNVAGFEFDTKGITFGADYRFTDQMVLGLAAGYLKTDTDLDANGGNLDTDGYSLSLYGTFYQDSGLYLDGILSYGRNSYDQNRRIDYDIGGVSVRQNASSDFDGNQLSLALGGGFSMSQGPLSFGPTARFEYVKVDVDGYNETMSNPNTAGGGWASHIDDQELKSFTSQLGGEVSYAISQSWGVLIPQAQAEWVHEFKDGNDQVDGFFLQDPSHTRFALDTDKPDKDYFNLRIGFSAQFSEGRSGYIYYRKMLGNRDLDVDSIGAGLRLEF